MAATCPVGFNRARRFYEETFGLKFGLLVYQDLWIAEGNNIELATIPNNKFAIRLPTTR